MSLVDELESSNAIEWFKEGVRADRKTRGAALGSREGVIKAASGYLRCPQEVVKVCMLSKSFCEAQMADLRKRCLEETLPNKTARIRLWALSLNSGELNGEFERIKGAHLYLDKNVEDIIRVDVLRTFSTDKEFDRDRLFVLLRCGTLALQNSVGYCQGMNYIAGLLLYLGLSDAEAFELYVSLLQRKLGVLFENNFEQMKCFFYVIENVLGVCLPEIAQELRAKKIEAGFFCSSWLITLFSSALQYTRYSPLCLNIIDMFIADGFKALFRVVVALLSFFRHRLIGKSFEETMEFLSEVIQTEVFKATQYREYFEAKKERVPADELKARFRFWEEYEFAANIKKVCRTIRVTDGFVARLTERYFALGAKLNRL